jgi:hypothetical protein
MQVDLVASRKLSGHALVLARGQKTRSAEKQQRAHFYFATQNPPATLDLRSRSSVARNPA